MMYGGKDELFTLDSDSESPFRKRKRQKTIKCKDQISLRSARY